MGLDDIRDLRLILPEPKKREEITRRIETSFNYLDHVIAEQNAATKLLSSLDTSILSRAIQGKLIPQDPTDEPASTLIASIRAERHAVPRKTLQMRKIKRDDLMMNKDHKDRLLQDSYSWPDIGLPFEEVAKRNPMPHDTIRDAIFALLAEEKPILRQVFNKEAECMHLQRVKA